MEKIHTFTIDNNCILAVANREPAAPAIQALADAHARGLADVAVAAISASERQQENQIENFVQFQQRLAELGLGHLNILPAMLYFDVTFWDHSLWSDDDMEKQEKAIHEILFSNVEFLWPDFCAAHGLNVDNGSSGTKWRNAKCDVQALWAHIHHRRDVFVTSDGNFHKSKKAALISLGSGQIEYPEAAAKLIKKPPFGTHS